ncbi:MAG: M20/M25/M40 family metallo-hydrolase, partial [Actinobacteria bacterium]|nr:M20/M25/M40 family metallo-hydrolase [Actinomycetota bacterium]
MQPAADVSVPALEELFEWLRIPSISADPAHGADVRGAGEWLCERLRAAGGTAELVDWHGQPLAVGELRASSGAESAPTVLVYGHFDVQPPAPLEQWDSPPFEPTVRDGWLYARGVADDKGQLFLLLKAAEELAAEGALPVNVRFACDGEEETGGHSIVDFLAADERGADACVIFDSSMLQRGVPAFNIGTRGVMYYHVEVRTGERDLHSGVFGGAALNAMEAMLQTLSGVLPREGRLPDALRAGLIPPAEAELAAWR